MPIVHWRNAISIRSQIICLENISQENELAVKNHKINKEARQHEWKQVEIKESNLQKLLISKLINKPN